MNLKKRFQQSRIPAPPPGLREKVLSPTLPMSGRPKDVVDRLWESRLLRVGWAASVFGLALFLLYWNPPAPGMPRTPPYQAEVSLNGDLEPDLKRLYQQRIHLSQQKRDETAFLVRGASL